MGIHDFENHTMVALSEIKVSEKIVYEYQEKTITGQVVRLKAYDNKYKDVHEHVIKQIDSFREYIDKELQEREEKKENWRSPIIIEFKFYNIEIVKIFTDSLYGLQSLNDQSLIDFLDLMLFFDWKGKADTDDVLQNLRKMCFGAFKHKLKLNLNTLSCVDLTKIVIIFGIMKVDVSESFYTISEALTETEFYTEARKLTRSKNTPSANFDHIRNPCLLSVLSRNLLEYNFKVTDFMFQDRLKGLIDEALDKFDKKRTEASLKETRYQPFNQIISEVQIPQEGEIDFKSFDDQDSKNLVIEGDPSLVYLGNIPIKISLVRNIKDQNMHFIFELTLELPDEIESVSSCFGLIIERLNGEKLINNYRDDHTNQIRGKYPYTHNFTKDSIVYKTEVNGVPLLENILKVKLVFESLVPVFKEN